MFRLLLLGLAAALVLACGSDRSSGGGAPAPTSDATVGSIDVPSVPLGSAITITGSGFTDALDVQIGGSITVIPDVGSSGQPVRLEVEQITSGTKHHLFGYIGHALTIPWNQSGRYIVSLRTDFYKRMPNVGETADVVLIDTYNNYAVTAVDTTRAWNLQQGTMLYWNPNAPETQFFFNDLDTSTGAVWTVLFDISTMTRVREYKLGTGTVANCGVAPDGSSYAGINYGKISRLREIISYAGAVDETLGGSANPDTDGLFRVDIATGTRTLLVSYDALVTFLAPLGYVIDPAYPIYVHHTLWNRDSNRIVFKIRGGGGGPNNRPNKWPNVGMVIRPNGTNLALIDWAKHPEWYEGNLLSFGDDANWTYDLYNVDTKTVTGVIGTNGTFPEPTGDNAYSPDGQWYVGSHLMAGDTRRAYTVYRFSDGISFTSPSILTMADGSTTRIDGAPRWNRTSDAILVGGVASDGTRQMSIIRLAPGP
jgi:hypothetical protein